MSKKSQVKMLLELLSVLPNIPTKDSSIDMEKFYEVEEVKAVIVLLKFVKADAEYLKRNGFWPAYLLLAQKLQ